jgi:hypothetical protein
MVTSIGMFGQRKSIFLRKYDDGYTRASDEFRDKTRVSG